MPGRDGDRRARYLIVKLAALGDVVLASTLIAAVRAQDSAAHITWVCGASLAPLVRLFEGVDEVVTVDERALLKGSTWHRGRALLSLWRTLVHRRFDVTLVAHVDARYRLLVPPWCGGDLRALQPAAADRMLPLAGRYFGDEYARLLDSGERRGPVVGHPALATLRAIGEPSTEHQHVGIVLVPGGARNVLRESAVRRWPVARYAELAGRLLAAGHPVTLVGDQADAWVRPAFGGLALRDEIGVQSIEGTLALLSRASLVITHDTGPLHLAALVRAPLLGLFGPTMPSQFMPRYAGAEALWGGADLACRPCYDGREFAACANNLCMQDIATDVVVDHALSRLARRPPVA